MTEEEKIHLYELNETYTDGFVRGYNRGFLDGMYMVLNLEDDEKLNKVLRSENNETK